MIIKPRREQGLQLSPTINKKYNLIKEAGPGVFVTGHVTKQGGVNDLTQVALFIDGVNVTAITFIAADNIGLDEQNNSGMKLVKGFVDCLSIQFNEPLYFKESCVIEVSIGSDAGIAQIVAIAVIGGGCSYPV
jgi:hypothetical protein